MKERLHTELIWTRIQARVSASATLPGICKPAVHAISVQHDQVCFKSRQRTTMWVMRGCRRGYLQAPPSRHMLTSSMNSMGAAHATYRRKPSKYGSQSSIGCRQSLPASRGLDFRFWGCVLCMMVMLYVLHHAGGASHLGKAHSPPQAAASG